MVKAKNKYILPVRKEDLLKIDRTSSPAHKGKLKNSVDFIFAKLGDFSVKNKPIYAAADGEVVFVRNNSRSGGPDKKYWYKGNRIVIKHKNKEYTAYEHLRYKGAKVKIRDKVKAGQLIGYSGNTGYTFGSHLHFEVFRFTGPDKYNDFETLKVEF